MKLQAKSKSKKPKKRYEPKNLWKTWLILQPVIFTLTLYFAHSAVADFIGGIIGGQFLILAAVFGNLALKNDPYLKSAKSQLIAAGGFIFSVALCVIWWFVVSQWLFQVWTTYAGTDAEADIVSYELIVHRSKMHDWHVSEVGPNTVLYVTIKYDNHKGQLIAEDEATEAAWYTAIRSGDGIRVRYLSALPSVVFSKSQLGLPGTDIIDRHSPLPKAQPSACPSNTSSATPIACFYDPNVH